MAIVPVCRYAVRSQANRRRQMSEAEQQGKAKGSVANTSLILPPFCFYGVVPNCSSPHTSTHEACLLLKSD